MGRHELREERELDYRVAERLGFVVKSSGRFWRLRNKNGWSMGQDRVTAAGAWTDAPYFSTHLDDALSLIKGLSFTVNHYRDTPNVYRIYMGDKGYYTDFEDEAPFSVAIVKCWLKLQDMIAHE